MIKINEKYTTAEEILVTNGLKITQARLSILNIFIKSKVPISADNIHQYLEKNKKIRIINDATIYRTLSSFEKSEILIKINLRKESDYFELNNDHHHHIVCTNCGMIEDFTENKKIEKVLNNIIEKSTKFKNIKEHSLELFGICKVCN